MTQDDLSSVGFDVQMSDLDRRQPLGIANPDSSAYVHIAEDFCPYIRPAIETQAFFQSQYSLAALRGLSVDDRAAEGLLYVAIIHTEWLRQRRARSDQKTRQLICDTIVITDDDHLSWEALASVVMWPQWILKYLYSSVGIMFANFWRGYVSSASDGRDIPPPPRTFFAIRSAVPPRDSEFLVNDAAIATFIEKSRDEGQNVHLPIAAVDINETLSAAALKDLRYFDRARMWSYSLLPEALRERMTANIISGCPR
jgi:hypothetical protein